ncbi:DUF6438 domain-containing protein [Mucilaginibacter sp. NFX135]|uniref:DUF6438 domain-containing protein n=1 Tax=Mucilaginibacter sp. NFX135 TaxID=3402687 RepID=UPI003AFA81EE
MKYLLLFLIFSSFIVSALANGIDNLKTDNDVLKFMLKTDTNFSYKGEPQITVVPTDTLFKLLKCNDVARQWSIKSWEKTDFNQDGKTDLLVMLKMSVGFYVYAVIDKGDNTFKMLPMNQGHTGDNCEMAKPIMINKQQLLLFYSKMLRMHRDKDELTVDTGPRIDTLILKHGNFVEYNPKPDNYQISYFTIEAKGCYGDCPVYKLQVSADGKATYEAYAYNEVEGNFKGAVSVDKLNRIKSLINYIQIRKLRDDYRVAWTDDVKAILKVGFKNGTVKEITDYGMIGTHGLSQLYNLIDELRTSEKWVKVK